MRNLAPILGLALVGCGMFNDPVGEAAPPFQGWGTDNKNHSMLDITLKKPLFAVFVDPSDPAGLQGLEFAELVRQKTMDRVEVLGVAMVPPLELGNFQVKHPTLFPVIADPDKKITRAYKLTGNPSFVLIGLRGVHRMTWKGSTRAFSRELAEALKSDLPKDQLPAPFDAPILEPNLISGIEQGN